MPLPRLVLDTNVVLDMLHFTETSGQALLQALEAGEYQCFSDADALIELARVVTYPKLRIPHELGETLVKRYAGLSTQVTRVSQPPYTLPRCRDKDDQKFLEIAATVAADAVVSKDNDLLRLAKRKNLNFRILKPLAAVAWLTERSALQTTAEDQSLVI